MTECFIFGWTNPLWKPQNWQLYEVKKQQQMFLPAESCLKCSHVSPLRHTHWPTVTGNAFEMRNIPVVAEKEMFTGVIMLRVSLQVITMD